MTREADETIPIGPTWVDYTPYVMRILEHNAQRGHWRVVIYFRANNTNYLFDLDRMIQVNPHTGRQRPMRRLMVTHATPAARL
jgi:hypothetical protein